MLTSAAGGGCIIASGPKRRCVSTHRRQRGIVSPGLSCRRAGPVKPSKPAKVCFKVPPANHRREGRSKRNQRRWRTHKQTALTDITATTRRATWQASAPTSHSKSPWSRGLRNGTYHQRFIACWNASLPKSLRSIIVIVPGGPV